MAVRLLGGGTGSFDLMSRRTGRPLGETAHEATQKLKAENVTHVLSRRWLEVFTGDTIHGRFAASSIGQGVAMLRMKKHPGSQLRVVTEVNHGS